MSNASKTPHRSPPHDDESCSLEELKDQLRNVTIYLNFDELAKDGSNFTEWREETARAINMVTAIRGYCDGPFPDLDTRIGRQQNRAAMVIVDQTINTNLRKLIRKCDTAEDMMTAFQNHFQKGGRTSQFALFQKLISIRPNLLEDDIIEHTSKIDGIMSELEASGFRWDRDSITGLFYQLNLPADTTKAVNKELDSRFKEQRGLFPSSDIRTVIQNHLSREKIANETANFTNLAASIDAMAFTPLGHDSRRNQRPFPHAASQNRSLVKKINWKDGPGPISHDDSDRLVSLSNPLPIPDSALPPVKAGRPQCFFCSSFDHGYNECPQIAGNHRRTAAHYNDWRKLRGCNYMYSLNVLFPHIYKSLPPAGKPYQQPASSSRPTPQTSRGPHRASMNIQSLEVQDEEPDNIQVAAVAWSSDGIDLPDGGNKVPTEYLFDGGATDAVSNNRNIFLNYQLLSRPIPIRTATNESTATVIGKGDVLVRGDNCEPITIKNVYHCPTATTTILSPGVLIEQGASVSMNFKHNMRVKLKSGETFTATHKNRRWFVKAWRGCMSGQDSHPRVSVCAMKTNDSVSRLWHSRFGHVAMRRIGKLFREATQYGLPDVSLSSSVICDDCMRCKSTRTRVLNSSNCEIGLLDVIVSDVVGPFPPCLSGEKLLVTFRDIASTYSKAVIINNKSQVAGLMMNTIKQWERETGVKVKRVRSDRGGEYSSAALDKWLRDEGISHEFSNPYEPEQNGTAERLNRTIGEIARTLLLSAKLPQQFWHLAYLTAVYIHNRVPNSITKEVTPYELFFGRKPQLDIIRTFGTKAFVHIHRGQRPPGKLQDHGRECIMVVYLDGGKGWLFYDQSTKTLFPSAVAKFPYEGMSSEVHAAQPNRPRHADNDVRLSQETSLRLPLPNKGSIQHIINALKVGDHSVDIKIANQDTASLHVIETFSCSSLIAPPTSFFEAMRSEYADQWRTACDEEMNMMNQMKVWRVVDNLGTLSPIGLKWVFTFKKFNDDGNPTKFKARLVAKGFKQQFVINYNETFAPTATFAGLRIMLTIAAFRKWPVHAFDVSSAYLHSDIDSDVYFALPTGYMCEERKKNKILKALKALYGTKQGARCWWKHLNSILSDIGFKSSQYDQSLYVFRRQQDTCIIWLHSDDGGVTGSSEKLPLEIRDALKEKLLLKWETTLDQIVGVNVNRTTDGTFELSQPGLTWKILDSFLPENRTANTPLNLQKIPVSPSDDEEKIDSTTYLSAIGSLNYLSVATRPDITYAVNYLARFSADPRRQHWDAVLHLIRYINGSGTKCLRLQPIRQSVRTPLHTYADANWGGEGAQSSHGFITFFLDSPISWTSKRQNCVPSSTCHAEYMALGTACRDAIWIRNLVEDLTGESNVVDIHCDNTSAIHVASDNSSNKRTRHSDREYYYINEQVYKGRVFVRWIDSSSQRADPLTKPLGPVTHRRAITYLKLT